MLFLFFLIWYLQYVETEIQFIIPALAVLIRIFYVIGSFRFNKTVFLIGIAFFLMIPLCQGFALWLLPSFVSAPIQSEIAPQFIPPYLWFAFRIACSSALILTLILNFFHEYSRIRNGPESIKQIVYFGFRCFPVIRVLGEETIYTHKLLTRSSRSKTIRIKISQAVTTIFTFMLQLIQYINNTVLIIDTRGGLPPMNQWLILEKKKLWIGDCALILLIMSIVTGRNTSLVPSKFYEWAHWLLP